MLFFSFNILVIIIFGLVFLSFKRIFDIDKSLLKLLSISLYFHVVLIIIILFDLNKYYDPYVVNSHFFNDGESYSSNAWIISHTLRDKLPQLVDFKKIRGLEFVLYDVFMAAQSYKIIDMNEYQVGFITYLYSVIYAAYGYLPSYIHIFNISINLLTGMVIFKICCKTFNRKTALISTGLFLFNPVTFYYSTTKLKEPFYFFISYLIIYLAILLVIRRNIIYFLLIIPLLLLIKLTKEMYFIPFILALVIYFMISFLSKKKLIIILISILFFIKYDLIYNSFQEIFSKSGIFNRGYVGTGGSTYNLLIFGPDPSQYSIFGKIIYIFNGWYHLIFEPIISRKLSLGLFAYYPYKIIFIILFTLAILGVLLSFRYNIKYRMENILLLLFLFFIGSIIALGSGNIGTMLRHRDIITPVIFIYASYFISLKKSFKLPSPLSSPPFYSKKSFQCYCLNRERRF